jgi:hypothetical protein
MLLPHEIGERPNIKHGFLQNFIIISIIYADFQILDKEFIRDSFFNPPLAFCFSLFYSSQYRFSNHQPR